MTKNKPRCCGGERGLGVAKDVSGRTDSSAKPDSFQRAHDLAVEVVYHTILDGLNARLTSIRLGR